VGEVQDCNLILLSKQPSSTPDILDGENNKLKQHAWNFYVGLLLASTFARLWCMNTPAVDFVVTHSRA
jgi:hypothetical protein